MTDENKQVLNEEDRATLEEPEAPAEEAPAVKEPTPSEPDDAQASVTEDAASPGREQELPQDDTKEDPDQTDTVAEETAISEEVTDDLCDEEPETARQADEPMELVEETAPATDEFEEDAWEAVPEEEPSPAGLEPAQEDARPQEQTPTVESVIEAILFATDEPLTESKLAGIVETTAKQVRESIGSLNQKYEANHSAFRIEQIAGGYQMLTLSIYNSWLAKMLRVRSDNKLSPAAMETLAIVAYKQPIIRADIEAIRGVAVGEVIRSLMYKGLVKIVGRAEILGRPMLYGTTKKFLEVFGLNSLKDLPKAEDLKNPDRG